MTVTVIYNGGSTTIRGVVGIDIVVKEKTEVDTSLESEGDTADAHRYVVNGGDKLVVKEVKV